MKLLGHWYQNEVATLGVSVHYLKFNWPLKFYVAYQASTDELL
jgi:hypothetical protein